MPQGKPTFWKAFLALLPPFFLIDLWLHRDVWWGMDHAIASLVVLFVFSAGTALLFAAGIYWLAVRSNNTD